MSKVLLDKEVLQGLVDYLATKPFVEVFALIESVSKSAVDYEEPKFKKKAKKEEKS